MNMYLLIFMYVDVFGLPWSLGRKDFSSGFNGNQEREQQEASVFENPIFSLPYNAIIGKMYILCQLEFCKG